MTIPSPEDLKHYVNEHGFAPTVDPAEAKSRGMTVGLAKKHPEVPFIQRVCVPVLGYGYLQHRVDDETYQVRLDDDRQILVRRDEFAFVVSE